MFKFVKLSLKISYW